MPGLPDVVGAARNLAAWHDVNLAALGVETFVDAGVWRAGHNAPGIYYTAITLDPDADPAVPRAVVCDSFDRLDVAPPGLRRQGHAPWYGRSGGAAAVEAPLPAGVRIEPVRAAEVLAQFEQAAADAFGVFLGDRVGSVHPPAILDAPGLLVLVALDGDEVLGTAMALDDGAVLGIYAVGVVPTARNRGIATALTVACLSWRPDRPTALQPTPESGGLYRRLGFTEIGRYAVLRPSA